MATAKSEKLPVRVKHSIMESPENLNIFTLTET